MKPWSIVLVAASLAFALTASRGAQADSCVDLRTNTVYDCKGAPPEAKAAPPKQSGTTLRDQLREKLANSPDRSTNKPAQADNLGERIKSAGDRAHQALTSGAMTNDSKERAQFHRDYENAMRDMGKAYDDAAAASPGDRAEILALKQRAEADFAASAADSGVLDTPPPQAVVAPAPAPDPNLFTTCGEADRQGIRTCYEVPPSGLSCRKILQQGGDRVWNDDQATCESVDILQQRNAYFAALRQQQAKPLFGDGDIRKADAFGAMSPKCQAQLNKMLEGADTGDKEMAYMAYGSLRAECDAEIRRLSKETDADLPERKLSSRARSAMDRAMNADPNRLVELAGDRNADASYDIGEIIDFATSLLNLIASFQGATVGHTNFGTVVRQGSGGGGSAGSRGNGPTAPRVTPRPVVQGCRGVYVCSAQ